MGFGAPEKWECRRAAPRFSRAEGLRSAREAGDKRRDVSLRVGDRNLRSKRIFMFLMMFSAPSETRAVPQVPIVTIPTN